MLMLVMRNLIWSYFQNSLQKLFLLQGTQESFTWLWMFCFFLLFSFIPSLSLSLSFSQHLNKTVPVKNGLLSDNSGNFLTVKVECKIIIHPMTLSNRRDENQSRTQLLCHLPQMMCYTLDLVKVFYLLWYGFTSIWYASIKTYHVEYFIVCCISSIYQ
jgi:hypothetical protein